MSVYVDIAMHAVLYAAALFFGSVAGFIICDKD